MKRGKYLATVPPQEILPVIDSRYESSVRGIYVIGDVTGFPLVKIAANQGREVIEKMEEARVVTRQDDSCLLYTSPSPRDQRGSRMPSSA